MPLPNENYHELAKKYFLLVMENVRQTRLINELIPENKEVMRDNKRYVNQHQYDKKLIE